MSTPDRIRKSSRAKRKKPVLDVDLNAAPPCENRDLEGTSTDARLQLMQGGQQGASLLPTPIDVEALDDDVIISSPRAFAEAKNNSRRNHGRPVVVDVESEERPVSNKRRKGPTNQPIINYEIYINLEGSSNNKKSTGKNLVEPPPPPPPPPPPKELTFNCPVCMGPLEEETSTKCGHIFCKTCIKKAIVAQNKCPTCRKRVTSKDIHRVYLPATGTS